MIGLCFRFALVWYNLFAIYSARRSKVKRVREGLENSLRGRIELIDSYAKVRFCRYTPMNLSPSFTLQRPSNWYSYTLPNISDFFDDRDWGRIGLWCSCCWTSKQCGKLKLVTLFFPFDMPFHKLSRWYLLAGKYCGTNTTNHGTRKSWRGISLDLIHIIVFQLEHKWQLLNSFRKVRERI